MQANNSGQGPLPPTARGPVAKPFVYSTNSIAPHSATQRWAYTVPTSRRALCQTSFLQIIRQTAAGASAGVYTFIDLTPNGGSTTQIANMQFISNTVGASVQSGGCSGLDIGAGDVVSGYTGDNSTTGTMMYSNEACFIEYDA